MKTFKLKIEGLDCANCAIKIEDKIAKTKGISNVSLVFMSQTLTFDCEEESYNQIVEEIIKVTNKIEPDAKVILNKEYEHENNHEHEECSCGHEHHDHEECSCGYEHHDHEECSCGHEHHDHEECNCGHEHHEHEECSCGHEHHDHEECNCGHEHHDHEECSCGHEHELERYKLFVEGLDCANCAAKIEERVKKINGLSDVSLVFMSQTLSFKCDEDNYDRALEEIKKIVKQVEPDANVVIENKEIHDHDHTNECSCGHNHDDHNETHNHEHGEGKNQLNKIIGASILFFAGLIFEKYTIVSLVLFGISYLLVGYEVIVRAVKNILRGEIFDENFLMAIATLGAIGIREYPEAVAVMLFYQVGEYFQDMAVEKSRQSISSLMDIRPDVAYVLENGEVIAKDPSVVKINDLIVVKPGEKIPLDGIVVEGKSALDTKALTGESNPRDVEEEDFVLSGSINISGVLTIKVTNVFAESTVGKILDLVQNASSKKAPAENFITKFARVYTPAVVFLAVLIAIGLPLIFSDITWSESIHRALSFLVVSCPCALVISVPLSYFGGIGGLSKLGILTKGSSYLDILTQVDTFVFDKTGTLTEGRFVVTSILSDNPEECLKITASVEKNSNHPISKSIVKAYDGSFDLETKEVKEIAGRGLTAQVDSKFVAVGNLKLMNDYHIEIPEINEIGTLIYVAVDNKYLGTIVLNDEPKKDSKLAIQKLHALNKSCIMLTGDKFEVAEKVANELGIDEFYSDLLPQNKVEKMEEILSRSSGRVAFVGDGINDAPVLAMADLGFAMGNVGSDASIEAADIVIMNDEPSSILTAIAGAKKTKNIVIQNIVFAILVKIGVLLLVAVGLSTMWEAVFADVGVSVIAICNAIRALKLKK